MLQLAYLAMEIIDQLNGIFRDEIERYRKDEDSSETERDYPHELCRLPR